MKDWNVIVTVFQNGYRRAVRALREFGAIERGPYHNVLVMAVPDPILLLEQIEQRTKSSPMLYDAISRVAPAHRCFDFHSADEFLASARQCMIEWAPASPAFPFTYDCTAVGCPASSSPRMSNGFSTTSCSRR